jgi:hypothetical protein
MEGGESYFFGARNPSTQTTGEVEKEAIAGVGGGGGRGGGSGGG